LNYLSSNLKKYHPVPAIVWGLFIFILCFMPGSAFPEVGWASALAPDKWVHAALFAIWMMVYATGGQKRAKMALLRPAIGMFLFGGMVELFQENILTDRSGEWLDWLADGVGLGVGLLLLVGRTK
jgi:hypothetical protein